MTNELSVAEIVRLVVDMVEPLIVVIMAFWLYRSIPRESVHEVLDAAERNASRTVGTTDDDLVRVARMVTTILLGLQDQPIVKPTEPFVTAEAQDAKKKTEG